MKERTKKLADQFFEENPGLKSSEKAIMESAALLTDCFKRGGKLLACGNGGSCADGDHIAGELMKGFLLRRPLPSSKRQKFAELFGEEGEALAARLQEGLPAISLGAQNALITAIANDCGYGMVFAQQVMGYALPGDVLMGISTSGNAENIKAALMAAKALGAASIALTGRGGGQIAALADVWLPVPDDRTFRVQEYHAAVYHLLCACAESELFDE
ncbi:MAG: D-sedoheptulose-7-phosphate isomerase [Aminivibrio sp.]|jgi:D-sedoheptulose 7-phosphate isomerase